MPKIFCPTPSTLPFLPGTPEGSPVRRPFAQAKAKQCLLNDAMPQGVPK